MLQLMHATARVVVSYHDYGLRPAQGPEAPTYKTSRMSENRPFFVISRPTLAISQSIEEKTGARLRTLPKTAIPGPRLFRHFAPLTAQIAIFFSITAQKVEIKSPKSDSEGIS